MFSAQKAREILSDESFVFFSPFFVFFLDFLGTTQRRILSLLGTTEVEFCLFSIRVVLFCSNFCIILFSSVVSLMNIMCMYVNVGL